MRLVDRLKLGCPILLNKNSFAAALMVYQYNTLRYIQLPFVEPLE